MAVSKVVLGDETLIDLTGDSVSSENLLQGETAHGANGEEVIGGVVVTPMYTGTKSAIEEAIALGQIPEDAVVNITDDEETSSFQTQIDEINNSLATRPEMYFFDTVLTGTYDSSTNNCAEFELDIPSECNFNPRYVFSQANNLAAMYTSSIISDGKIKIRVASMLSGTFSVSFVFMLIK